MQHQKALLLYDGAAISVEYDFRAAQSLARL